MNWIPLLSIQAGWPSSPTGSLNQFCSVRLLKLQCINFVVLVCMLVDFKTYKATLYFSVFLGAVCY